MATTSDNGLRAQVPSDALMGLIEQIASEVHIKDYEVVCKQQEFTGDNYCGEISRVQIKPLKGDQKALHLIVKTAPTGENTRIALPIHTVYAAEMFAYTDIIPAFYRLYDEFNVSSEDRFSSATFYKGINEEMKEIIILKDLSDDGFIMTNKRSSFDYDHTALVLQNMARIHAASFVMKEKHPEQFSKLLEALSKEANFGEPLMAMIENIAGTIVERIECPKNKAKLESFVGKIRAICTEVLDSTLSEPYNVICHGDSWNNNMLFNYNKDKKVDRVVFIDWQVVRYSSPLADVCYVLCLSTDKDLLQSHLDQLLDLYYETLELSMKNMGCDVQKSFPKEVFMEHFKKLMPFGLSMVVGALPIAMCEPGDAKQIGDYDYNEGHDVAKQIIISDLAVRRINGMVDYFVKNDLI